MSRPPSCCWSKGRVRRLQCRHGPCRPSPAMRILIVEDEPLLAGRLAATCEERGHAVDVAAEGERADFLAGTETYDAIVLDLGLPKVDGLTLLERWRAEGIAAPVLVLTARGSWSEKSSGVDR